MQRLVSGAFERAKVADLERQLTRTKEKLKRRSEGDEYANARSEDGSFDGGSGDENAPPPEPAQGGGDSLRRDRSLSRKGPSVRTAIEQSVLDEVRDSLSEELRAVIEGEVV